MDAVKTHQYYFNNLKPVPFSKAARWLSPCLFAVGSLAILTGLAMLVIPLGAILLPSLKPFGALTIPTLIIASGALLCLTAYVIAQFCYQKESHNILTGFPILYVAPVTVYENPQKEEATPASDLLFEQTVNKKEASDRANNDNLLKAMVKPRITQ